jgi:hypothetical protein
LKGGTASGRWGGGAADSCQSRPPQHCVSAGCIMRSLPGRYRPACPAPAANRAPGRRGGARDTTGIRTSPGGTRRRTRTRRGIGETATTIARAGRGAAAATATRGTGGGPATAAGVAIGIGTGGRGGRTAKAGTGRERGTGGGGRTRGAAGMRGVVAGTRPRAGGERRGGRPPVAKAWA